jgi:hypothetical protein
MGVPVLRPLDKTTREGDFIQYRKGKRDRKTKTVSWQEFKFRYKVLNEDTAEHKSNRCAAIQ